MPSINRTTTQSWHDPFDGAPRQAVLGNDVSTVGMGMILLPRAVGDEILTVFPFTDSLAQVPFSFTNVAATFSVDQDCDIIISVNSAVSSHPAFLASHNLGGIAQTTYTSAGNPHTISFAVTPPAPGDTINNLWFQIVVGTVVPPPTTGAQFFSLTAVNGTGGPPPPIPNFWTDFVLSSEVP